MHTWLNQGAIIKNSQDSIVYWRELGVKIDYIRSMNEAEINVLLEKKLSIINQDDLKELARLHGLDVEQNLIKSGTIKSLLTISKNNKVRLLYLFDFLSRKKQTINNYFEHNYIDRDISHPLNRLVSILISNPGELFSIIVYNKWRNHSTGKLFSSSAKLNKSLTEKICRESTYQKELIDTLYKNSGEKNEYKIHSHCQIENEYIVQIYKLVDDKSREDFAQAIRNKVVSKILFSIKSGEKIIEIKSSTKYEEQGIIDYIKNTFDIEINEIKEKVFENLDLDKFKKAVIQGLPVNGDKTDDFLVDQVKFRESLVENSPSITFSIEGVSIWNSLYDAYNKNILEINSLKSIESLSFKSGDIKRKVLSTPLENGDVIFHMDDSRLNSNKKEIILKNFQNHFGFPLYRPISNKGTTVGEVDLINYILMKRNQYEMIKNVDDKERELLSNKILNKKKKKIIYCVGENCGYEQIVNENEVEFEDECPNCENDVKEKKEDFLYLDIQEINSYVKNKMKFLNQFNEWNYEGNSNFTINEKKYEMIKMRNIEEEDIYYIAIITEPLSNKTLKKLRNLLNPTLLIVVGQTSKVREKYTRGCIDSITFGDVYEREEKKLNKFLSEIFQRLKHKTKDFISEEASEARQKIIDNQENPKKNNYSPSDFEDDVYVILKDFFVNVQKWGHGSLGKPLPEGMLSASLKNEGSTKDLKKEQFVFSYDCKLNNDKKGYDINISERDKAVRYIENMNDSMEVKNFSTSKQIEAHIFISNKFKQNLNTAYDYINEKLEKHYETYTLFLTSDALLRLYEIYRIEYYKVENYKDIFLSILFSVFEGANGQIINSSVIDKVFEEGLKYTGKKIINFDEVKKDILSDVSYFFA